VTIGLSLTIPFAMLGDYLRGSTAALTTQAVIGAALVIVGFGLMGLEGWEEGTGETLTGVVEDQEEEDDARGRGLQRG
jgi:solute carrier family 35 protein F5